MTFTETEFTSDNQLLSSEKERFAEPDDCWYLFFQIWYKNFNVKFLLW